MKQPQGALGGISEISQGKGTTKGMPKNHLCASPPFVVFPLPSPHSLTHFLTMLGSLGLLQETFGLFSAGLPGKYDVILLRIMDLFSYHCLWWGMNLEKHSCITFLGEG